MHLKSIRVMVHNNIWLHYKRWGSRPSIGDHSSQYTKYTINTHRRQLTDKQSTINRIRMTANFVPFKQIAIGTKTLRSICNEVILPIDIHEKIPYDTVKF